MIGWQPKRYTRAQLEERRLAALDWLQADTQTHKDIAEHFGVSIKTVSTWVERHKQRGTLQATVAPGPTPRLTGEQREHVRSLLRQGALAHGFPDATWTEPRVRDVIGQHFGVWYHRDHVRKLLRSLGFSPQQPDGRAVERNHYRWLNGFRRLRLRAERSASAFLALHLLGCALICYRTLCRLDG
ncbi:helix-turn-helix domain-containing protein [Deinococcus pimensis]|uniref:helix-turn-helix domain-containing protein n=1 Tax=Deinococcus pimensis TaxID=309888 RepID=UPI001B7FCACB|nr:winged helix-turn-helix domain-containing protein [Deinococcus pimensis]